MRIRVQITGKDEFWGRAFHVEWEHQFPDRKLARCGADLFAAEEGWLADLGRVAAETFCQVVRAPENLRRRRWLTSFVARRGGD